MFRRRAETPSPPAEEPGGQAATGPARVLLGSGLFDQEFYEAQAGERFDSALAAARHAVSTGMPTRLSPHPSLDFHAQPARVRRPWRAGRVRVLLDHLSDLDAAPEPSEALRRHLIDVARRVSGPVDAPDPVVDWERAGEGRVAGRTSVVIPTYDDAAMTALAVAAVLGTTARDEVEVVVVDSGSRVDVAVSLARHLRERKGVRLEQTPR